MTEWEQYDDGNQELLTLNSFCMIESKVTEIIFSYQAKKHRKINERKKFLTFILYSWDNRKGLKQIWCFLGAFSLLICWLRFQTADCAVSIPFLTLNRWFEFEYFFKFATNESHSKSFHANFSSFKYFQQNKNSKKFKFLSFE